MMTGVAELCTGNGVISAEVQGDQCIVTVDGKSNAVNVRQQLVRHRIHCTFPVPTWKRSTFVIRGTRPQTMSQETFAEVLDGLSRDGCV
jgi:hypothetical protein